MRLQLPSGRRILISPVFFWESARDVLFTIRTAGAFHPSHVTTRLSLGLLEQHLDAANCQTLLDVGCGSGILALAGAALGVEMSVGLDIDRRAVRLARDNADRNDLAGRTRWLTGTCTAVRGSFDCVVANLPFEVLTGLLGELARLVADNGTLILSGFQDVRWHEMMSSLLDHGLVALRQVSGDYAFYGVPPSGSFTWMAMVATRAEQAPVPAGR
jgi:ribosomal protein L11 methyltransferase